VQFAGALYHVTSRGNEKQVIFKDDRDLRRRMDWMARTVRTYGWRLHAFVLMTNHDHLFVETPAPNLAGGMQYLNGGYTGYFNFRHRRVGHLFQGRYKAVVVENEGHYREISRYIHLNPVRAGMVARPEEWPWSSYPGYHRGRSALPWVTYSDVLDLYDTDEMKARRAYRQFVAAGLKGDLDSPMRQAVHGLILGSDRFVARIARMLEDRPDDPGVPLLAQLRDRPSIERIAQATARCCGVDPEAWSAGHRSDSMARALAAYFARRRHGYSATRVAPALGYAGPSSVSQAIRRVESQADRLAPAIAAIAKQITND
jgi:REP element-mobilizing transposase RayT